MAREGEILIAVGGVKVLAQAGPAARIDGQGVARLDRQHRLDFGRFVLVVKEFDLEQRRFIEGEADGANDRNADRELHEDVEREVRVHLDIEQVLEAPTLVVIHGGDFTATDAPVADPLDVGDIAGIVLGEHLAGNVLQVHASIEVDPAAATTSNRSEAHRQLQSNRSTDVKLVLFLSTRARDDLAVSELRQGEVVDEKAVDGIDRVAGAQRFTDAKSVKTESQVGEGLEPGHGRELQQHRPDRHLGQGHALIKLDTQKRQLVAEQHRIATGENRLPVVDALDVFEHLEARACCAARSPGRLGTELIELSLQISGQSTGRLAGIERARTKALERAQLDPSRTAPAADQAGHGGNELNRFEEVGRNLRLPFKAEQAIEQTQRRVFNPNDLGKRHATDGREHHVHKGLEGRDHAAELVRDRQQEVIDQAAHIDRQVGQVDLGCRHLLAVLPVPVDHQVGAQLGHGFDRAGHAERGLQIDVGIDAEHRAKGLAGRLTKKLGHAQPTFAVAAHVNAQQHVGTAGLEGLAGSLPANVDDSRLKEQQLTDRRKGLAALPAEVGQRLNAQFGFGVPVGAEVKAAGHAQPKTKVKGPAQVKGKAAVNVEREARKVKVQRNVDAGAHQFLAQLHVELDRVLGTGWHLADHPSGELDTILVKPGHLHITDADVGAGIVSV